MIELNITGVCRDCVYFDPEWILSRPYFDVNGKLHDGERKVECRHEKVCFRRREEKEKVEE